MKTIHVETSKQYDVLVGKGLISKAAKLSKKALDSNRVMIITDSNVEKLYAQALEENFIKEGFNVCIYVFKAGENSKNITNYYDILEALAENGFTRKDAIIALGGGVTGDLAGFVAASYMRGVRCIQIPTTLLAMVDSSVGGKTAININAGKNLVGAFWQPELVICDTEILQTLPEEVYSEGLGEVVKYGLLKNNKILKYIKRGIVNQHIEEIVTECIQIKADIVSQDEFEKTDVRKMLNAGHTVAHAIETKSGHKISHGEAVKIGLVLEAGLAWFQGLCSYETMCEIMDIVKCVGLKKSSYSLDDLVDLMASDKKNTDSESIAFVLPIKLGEYKVVNICKQSI